MASVSYGILDDLYKALYSNAVFVQQLVCGCFNESRSIKLNGRATKLVRLLGEGGYSYVYLAQDTGTQREFALKRIRCPSGTPNLEKAKREMDAYRRFRHPNIIRCLDTSIVQDAQGHTVYISLPLYQRSVQDLLDRGEVFDEASALAVFLGTAYAVKCMHQSTPSSSRKGKGKQVYDDGDDAHSRDDVPSMSSGSVIAPVFEDDSYAHRDIKPGNIMLDTGNTPILMDFGSVRPGVVPVVSRAVALTEQDTAAEESTMPYRAPELFDVRTGQDITTATDIWSLGCTLFAMLYGYSPFDSPEQATQGASVSLSVQTGKVSFPAQPQVSEGTKRLIRQMLSLDPDMRPDIAEVIARARDLA